ncbi:exported hypothetical protein [Mesorhizobium plurifarium]|uniref:Uncharacterized protein n=1 Tax=Mesorhizobium plurifarium TaxID=69974 RepID=A0A0K2VMC9_MESPL|nr:exported hypothetical protein [Mesorhizobium plurifarium]
MRGRSHVTTYGSASPLSARFAATSPPLWGGEEPRPSKGSDLEDLRFLAPARGGGEVARRSRDGEGERPMPFKPAP